MQKPLTFGWAAFFLINEDVNARVLYARDVDPAPGIPRLRKRTNSKKEQQRKEGGP
jgi:hypothetical protein